MGIDTNAKLDPKLTEPFAKEYDAEQRLVCTLQLSVCLLLIHVCCLEAVVSWIKGSMPPKGLLQNIQLVM